MVKVVEIRKIFEADKLSEQINKYIKDHFISRKQLIDIKFDRNSAYIIYDLDE